LDQVIFTMPFYASVAYSIGALLAPRMPADSQSASRIRFWASLTIGLVYIVEATLLLVQAKQLQASLRQSVPDGFGASRWLVLACDLVPVAAGGCLIYFADWLRRTKEIHSVADTVA
jgi:hypothetical protein